MKFWRIPKSDDFLMGPNFGFLGQNLESPKSDPTGVIEVCIHNYVHAPSLGAITTKTFELSLCEVLE